MQTPAGVTELLAIMCVVSLLIERILEFVVEHAFPAKGEFLGPGTASRRMATFALATVLGILVASQTSLGILAKLNPGVGRWFDLLFTGLLLAAGTQPIHSAVTLMETKKHKRQASPLAKK